MTDETARIARAKEDATTAAEVQAELKAHEVRLHAINGSIEKTVNRLDLLLVKLDTQDAALALMSGEIRMLSMEFKNDKTVVNSKAEALQLATQNYRDSTGFNRQSRQQWITVFSVSLAAITTVVSVLLYLR